MNRLLLIFTALLMSLGGFAQNLQITLTGTVAHPSGLPVPDQTVTITTDSLPNGNVYFATAVTDSNGEYTAIFQMDDADTQGTFYANTPDCDQTLIYGTAGWSPGNTTAVIDFIYCDYEDDCQAYAYPVFQEDLISATMWGIPPYSYEWDNGATTQTIPADGSGLYCVTVTDFVGCSSTACYDATATGDSSCFVLLTTVDSDTVTAIAANAYGLGNITYSWNTGEATAEIFPTQAGTYCVTTTDEEGCSASACIDYTPTNCSANILADEAAGSLTAQGDGAAPLVYEWSTGATSQTILIDPDIHWYGLTITDAMGCVAMNSYWYGGSSDTLCSVQIIPEVLQDGSNMLTAVPDPQDNNISYHWSTGATTSSIAGVPDGTYCVTITTSSGCEASACSTIQGPPNSFNLDGYVYLPDSLAELELAGAVYLIVYDENEETLTAVDTVPLQPLDFSAVAYYNFGQQPAGNYLIKAALAPESDGYDNHLPTYYGNVLWWDEASTVTVPNNGWGGFNIIMIEGDNPGGPGFIGGYVADGANLMSGEIEVRNDEPLAGVSILLLDQAEEPVTHTVSDASGEFEFPSLAWGTYKVVLEIPGLEQAYYWVTLSPDRPAAEGLRFEVGENAITSTAEVPTAAALTLFPNPASTRLFIRLPAGAQLQAWEVWNAQGQRVQAQTASRQNSIELDVANWPAGLYWLRAEVDGQAITHKWIKQ